MSGLRYEEFLFNFGEASAVDVEVALVQEKTGVVCAREAIALPLAALKAKWAASSE